MAYGNVNVPGVTVAELEAHTGSKSNPHAVTKSQIGLGNVDNTADVNKNVKSAGTLATARTIDGVSFNGSADITHYGNCSTEAATAAKVVACTGFTLATGARIAVKFTVTNTAASPTLNVNGTGAKAMYYRGSAINKGYLAANRTYEFIYNGTQYELVGDIDTNTTYSAATNSAAGLMSASDKTKLDGIATGATANTGTVTSVATGAGLTGGTITGSGTVKANLLSETKLANAAAAATETSGRVYPVAVDKNGKLAVNVPWTNTTYTPASAAPLMDGAAVVGTSAKYAREDHVHPVDTSRAAASHTHAAGDINSGTLNSDRLPTVPVSKGGTGQTTVAAARNALGLGNTSGAVPIANGGTGATTAAAARNNLSVYSKDEVDKLWWLSKTAVTLGPSALYAEVEVIGSNIGTITAVSSDTGIAVVSVSDTTVTVQAVSQGSATLTIANSATATSKIVAVTVARIPSNTLAGNSPATIQAVAQASAGSSYWSVGDKIGIKVNGTVGALTLNNTYYAFILGFDHNSDIEGIGIHFQFGKTANGVDIAFCDSKYNNYGNGAYFNMSTTRTNSGGWGGSYMRNTICAAFFSALPAEWQDIIAPCMKYSDNKGGGSDTASYVTSTADKIWLLSEFELQGVRHNANSAEQNYQAQYDYYKNGNSRIKYRHDMPTTASYWWTRSVRASSVDCFLYISPTTGNTSPGHADSSLAFSPGFVVRKVA